MATLSKIDRAIASCERCPRLRRHCEKMARVKRKSYASDIYHGRPITGFGDPGARLVIVGLAPAAHGANRTGRIFTGDRSGDWLYRALHKAGFANQAMSASKDDGLELRDAYVSCVVKCAPPDNKPTPAELSRCSTTHLKLELEALRDARVYLALGQIALGGLWPLLLGMGFEPAGSKPGAARSRLAKPKFSHGGRFEYALRGRPVTLLLSYHPSQQNTFTGRLTEPMFDSVFQAAQELL